MYNEHWGPKDNPSSECAKSESPSCEDHVQDRQEKDSMEKMKAVLENGFGDDMTGFDDRPVFREILECTNRLLVIEHRGS
jgi:hypothetical protein